MACLWSRCATPFCSNSLSQRLKSRRRVPRGAIRENNSSVLGARPLTVTVPYGSPCAARHNSAIHNPRAGIEHRLSAVSFDQSAQKNFAHRSLLIWASVATSPRVSWRLPHAASARDLPLVEAGEHFPQVARDTDATAGDQHRGRDGLLRDR
jgi:hypothetical protein